MQSLTLRLSTLKVFIAQLILINMDVVVMMLNLMQARIFRYEMMNSIKYCYLWCGDNSLSVHNDNIKKMS